MLLDEQEPEAVEEGAGEGTPAPAEEPKEEPSAEPKEEPKKEPKEEPNVDFKDFSVTDDEEEGEQKPVEKEEGKKSEEEEEKKPDEEAGSEEKPKEEKPKEKEEPKFELKVPESKEEPGDGEGYTWQDAGKDLDLKYEGESFKDLQTAIKANNEKIKNDAYEAAKKEILENPEELLKDVDENTRELIKLANDGNTDIAALMEPLAHFDKALAYDDGTLVKENLKSMESAPGVKLYTDDQIDAKITKFEENDMVGLEADRIREDLHSQKQSMSKQIIQNNKNAIVDAEQAQLTKSADQTTAFNASIDKVNEYMGGKLGDEAKAYTKGLWEKGEVHKMFENPDMVRDFVLYNIFGEQALQDQKTASFNKGDDGSKKDLHNVPPVHDESSGRLVKPEDGQKGENFESWGNVREEMQE